MYTITPREHEYDLVITGPIGAGKTTLVNKLIKYFDEKETNLGLVHEFIDGMDNGPEMLAKWLGGEITHENFQDYLIESYDYLNYKVYDHGIRLFERTPVEGAVIFSQGTSVYQKTLNGTAQLHEKYTIPDPRVEDPAIINATQTVEEIFQNATKIIEEDLINQTRRRILYLRIDSDTGYNRVNKRSREGEEAYSKEYLSLIIHRYEEMFRIKNEIH